LIFNCQFHFWNHFFFIQPFDDISIKYNSYMFTYVLKFIQCLSKYIINVIMYWWLCTLSPQKNDNASSAKHYFTKYKHAHHACHYLIRFPKGKMSPEHCTVSSITTDLFTLMPEICIPLTVTCCHRNLWNCRSIIDRHFMYLFNRLQYSVRISIIIIFIIS